MGGTPNKASVSPQGPRSNNDFNVMMATRYALDAIIGNAAGTPAEAVALVKDIYDGFVKGSSSNENATKEAL